METATDREARPRYLIAPMRPVCEIDAAIAEMEALLAEPVFQQRFSKKLQQMALMEVAAAALRWAREREAEGELAGDWHSFLDSCAANGRERR